MEADTTEGQFAPDPVSVRLARDLARAALADLDAGALGDVLVVVSELATNAVRHARSPFTLRIVRADGEVRVEVEDRSTAAPAPRQPDRGAPGGRGLPLIDALADAWGFEPRAGGKQVWANVRVG